MTPAWRFVTDFGDTAITVPIAFATFFILLCGREWRAALAWGFAVAGAAAVIGGLKIAFALCGHRFALPDLASPSGHSAMSITVYGGLAVLLGEGRHGWPRWLPLILAAFLAGAIAASRLVLRLHTAIEVVAGVAIGVAAVGAFALAIRTASGAKRDRLRPVPWIAAAALLLIVVFHGTEWPTEQAIHGSAGLFHWIVPRCG